MATRIAMSLVIAVVLGGCLLDWKGSRPGLDTAADASGASDGGEGETPVDAAVDDGPVTFDLVLDGPVEGGSDTAADANADQGPDAPAPDGGPANKCATPQTIALTSGGSLTVIGTTTGQTNEFGKLITCGSGYDFDGAQVYYKIALTGAKSYLLSLTTPKFNGALYIFKDKTCTASVINAQCAGSGDGGHSETGFSFPEKLLFTPKTSGDYIVVVDSNIPYHQGPFSLKIEEAAVPTHGACAKAKQVTLVGGKVTVNGDTALVVNEFAALQCKLAGSGVVTKKLAGPQLYYTWAVSKGQWYKLTLDPADTHQHLYVFESGACTAAAIASDCQSGGATGRAIQAKKGVARALYYRASKTGAAYFAVDSAAFGGGFTVKLEAIQTPTNTKCASPKTIPLSGGKGVVTGDTDPILTPDEFSTLQCYGSSGTYDGPQVYYSVGLKAGQTYLLSLTADAATDLVAYLFSGTCTQSKIRYDCNSQGSSGTVTPTTVSSGGITLVPFKPKTAGTYEIGVDSFYADGFGGFTLAVSEVKPPANDTCLTAETVTLTAGKATVSANKVGATSALDWCGATKHQASDLWYKFTPTPGKKYTITFKPHYPGGRFAVFDGNHGCNTASLITDCGNSVTTFVNGGGSASTKITASNTAIYFIADGLDSGYDNYAFSFEITEGP